VDQATESAPLIIDTSISVTIDPFTRNKNLKLFSTFSKHMFPELCEFQTTNPLSHLNGMKNYRNTVHCFHDYKSRKVYSSILQMFTKCIFCTSAYPVGLVHLMHTENQYCEVNHTAVGRKFLIVYC
jgi:hypothetical protein